MHANLPNIVWSFERKYRLINSYQIRLYKTNLAKSFLAKKSPIGTSYNAERNLQTSLLLGEQKKFSAAARQRAVTYLEKNLRKISDSYELAIVAYALAISGSAEADLAYGQLMAVKKEEGGMIYWSRSPIKTNRVRYTVLYLNS